MKERVWNAHVCCKSGARGKMLMGKGARGQYPEEGGRERVEEPRPRRRSYKRSSKSKREPARSREKGKGEPLTVHVERNLLPTLPHDLEEENGLGVSASAWFSSLTIANRPRNRHK